MFQPSFGVEREVGFWFRGILGRAEPSKIVAGCSAKVLLPLLELYFVCMVKNDTVAQELKA